MYLLVRMLARRPLADSYWVHVIRKRKVTVGRAQKLLMGFIKQTGIAKEIQAATHLPGSLLEESFLPFFLF